MAPSYPPIRVGIFLGGPSREREISFAGGRTIYDHLDRKYFEPVSIFVDSIGTFIRLHEPYLYKGTIREFYPPPDQVSHGNPTPLYIESCATATVEIPEKWIKAIGEKIEASHFKDYFDVALLCLHGPYGEDGSIQGLLQWYHMPYTGSSLLPSAMGINKVFQRKFLQQIGFPLPASYSLSQQQWLHNQRKRDLLDQIIAQLGLPFVVKSSRQGSSIGVSIVDKYDIDHFTQAVYKAFFIEEVSYAMWNQYTATDKQDWLNKLIDVRTGIGFPLRIGKKIFYTPTSLLTYMASYFTQQRAGSLLLISSTAEEEIILEALIEGREFSCVVLEIEKGKPIALPPTEILKEGKHFDYRAKYLPGIVRKQTPMELSPSLLATIRKKAASLFQWLHCQVYARIDGFLTKDNEIILNDPNTTVGMNPSSFLFHQAAAIGLSPTQLLTFLLKRSLEVRQTEGFLTAHDLLARLEIMLTHGKE